MMANDCDFELEVERYAAAYERAVAVDPEVQAADFFPATDHPCHEEIAIEILRIELELRWRQRGPTSLDDCCVRYGVLLSDPRRLETLAYEDYRQHCRAGLFISPRFYAERYGVDVKAWGSTVHSLGEIDSCVASSPASLRASRVRDRPAASIGDLPTPGTPFCGFHLIEELGRGTFARVFLAVQPSLANRTVALKISRGASAEPDRLALLQHSNIVPIHSVHDSGGMQALCMPYLGRHTLAHVLEQMTRHGRLRRTARELLSTVAADADVTLRTDADLGKVQVALTPRPSSIVPSIWQRFERSNYVDGAVWIMARLASGLAHAHERGILHHDLKPANVLISDDGRPMILDFNLANHIAPGVRSTVVGGTLAYMSPEKLDSFETGAGVDERSDLYALGVIFFELLTGRLPYPPDESTRRPLAELAREKQSLAPSVRKFNPHVPPSIARVVARCLEPKSVRRYERADELLEDLERHLENRPLRHVADYSPRERFSKWARRHPRASSTAGVAACSLIILAMMAALWATREGRLRRLQASDLFRSFAQEVEEARMPLSLVGADRETFDQGVAKAKEELNRYKLFSIEDWRKTRAYTDLDGPEQRALEREVARTLYVLAASTLRQASAEIDRSKQTELVRAAKHWNSLAATSIELVPNNLSAALRRQRADLQDWQPGTAQLSAAGPPSGAEAADDPELAAVDHFRQGRYSEALPRLLEWRDSDRSNLTAWLLLGEAYVGIGNLAEAEVCFTTCTRLRPQFPLSYFQRGLARLEQKKYDAAVADFSRYLELNGSSSAALINRALALMAKGDPRAALGDLNRVVEEGASHTRVYFIRAAVRQSLRDAVGAREDYQQGMTLTPSDSMSWIARGMAQLKRSPERALSDFQRALNLDPGNRSALQNILHVLTERLDRPEEALALLDDQIVSHPDDFRALATRAVIHARRGSADLAVADAEQALKLNQDPKMLLQIACAYANLASSDPQHEERALELCARALGSDPQLAARAAADVDLQPIRSTAEFQRILRAAKVIENGGRDVDTHVAIP